jgi:predicted O-linked N-acetylglucosamine transferase (SPINDLY family)
MDNQASETSLALAKDHANFGRNPQFLEVCDSLVLQNSTNVFILQKVGSLYLQYGFPTYAKDCFEKALLLSPNDPHVALNLANALLQLGQPESCKRIYQDLLERFPNNCQVLQHLLYLSEYLPESSNAERLSLAKKWAELTVMNANGPHARPEAHEPIYTKLRIGYLSADFCQHTVGLLIKDVLDHHNTDQFEVFCYSNGNQVDWVTASIQGHSHFLDVGNLSDIDLAKRIQEDRIHILIDLSGHTGGSRLPVFAYRPAPVQLSWLGYYATTGLDCLDGVLLDQWHIHEDIASQFIEPIVSLPLGRWIYSPVYEPAPLITSPPAIKNGYITFGSFNNTLKYNPAVYQLWSKILLAIPTSKLILKWRTFNDPEFRSFVLEQFKSFGVDATRIELRGPSFHLYMLAEYQDIDIALDPFPFSGGVTSCEALYMGVPVITWPQNRVVSRQTKAFLSSIAYAQWAVDSAEEYVQRALELAGDVDALCGVRDALRMKMIASPLMQKKDFTRSLEEVLLNTFDAVLKNQPEKKPPA